jgi:hypothetical protein
MSWQAEVSELINDCNDALRMGDIDRVCSSGEQSFVSYRKHIGGTPLSPDGSTWSDKSSYDGVLIQKNSRKDQVGKIHKVVADLIAEPFPIKYHKITEAELWLRPARKEDVSADLWPHIVKSYGKQTVSGDVINAPERIASLMATFNKSIHTNIFFRYLKYYISTFEGDLFVQDLDNSVIRNSDQDIMASVRLTMLFNFILFYEQFQDDNGVPIVPLDVQIEIFEFMFSDPWWNLAALKKTQVTIGHAFLAGSSSGVFPKFGAVPRDGRTPVFPGFHTTMLDRNIDRAYLEYVKDFLTEDFAGLKKLNLPKYSAFVHSLIYHEVGDLAVRKRMWVNAFPGFAGYTRGDVEGHIKKQVEENMVPVEGAEPIPPYHDILSNKMEEVFDEIYQRGTLLSPTAWRAAIAGVLTSKSAGGGKVTIYLDLDPDNSTGELSTSKLTLIFTDKDINFFALGEECLTTEAISRAYSTVLGGENAKIGFRQVVGGKGERPIYMETLPKHLANAILHWAWLLCRRKNLRKQDYSLPTIILLERKLALSLKITY